jgi:Na+-driven multidrug efflux pump
VAIGRGARATAILAARNLLLLTPMVLLLPIYLGIDGVWAALAATDLLCFGLIAYYARLELNRATGGAAHSKATTKTARQAAS